MDILQEIRNYFASLKTGHALKIKSLPDEYPAWIIKQNKWYGVGIPYPKDKKVSEKFSSVKLWSDTLIIGQTELNLLILSSSLEQLRYEFASICAHFADPGKLGEYRRELINNPTEWWTKWKLLLGNAVSDKKTYSIIGEMLTLEKLIDSGEKPVWSATKRATHDIELESSCFEVKSTLSRQEMIVTISSQFQLQQSNYNTWLVFCRFEPTNLGVSVDDLVDRLAAKGMSRIELNEALENMGLEEGSSARSEKYKLLEMKKFLIDENFPIIDPNLYSGNTRIKKITYQIDLQGLDCTDWMA